MAEHNNSDDADAAFLNALKAEQEMAEARQKASELGEESEPIGDEPGERTEQEATFRELSDQVEEDNHLQSNESKDTSTAASGATSLLPGVAVASPDDGPSSVNGSAVGDSAAQPLLNANMGAGPNTQESSAIPSPSVTPVGALVPDENNNDSVPHALSVTSPTAGSNNNDSLPVSSTTPAPVNAPSAAVPVQSPVQKGNSNVANKRKRLPQDIVGQLEDRIAEDPRGDIDAWLALIEEHRKKGKFDDVRAVYERFFVVFPAAVGVSAMPSSLFVHPCTGDMWKLVMCEIAC